MSDGDHVIKRVLMRVQGLLYDDDGGAGYGSFGVTVIYACEGSMSTPSVRFCPSATPLTRKPLGLHIGTCQVARAITRNPGVLVCIAHEPDAGIASVVPCC